MRVIPTRGSLFFFFSIVLVFLGCATSSGQAPSNSPMKISPAVDKKIPVPVIELPIPQNAEQKNYLGISGYGRFKISQIKSQVIIIEYLCTECPHCRNTASQVNELYLAIQARPDLKDKIKIIGIVGNSPSEITLYRARYKVPFPLFSDQDETISQKLGVNFLPKFIGVKINSDGTTEEFYRKTGEFWFWNVDRFLKKIIELSNLE